MFVCALPCVPVCMLVCMIMCGNLMHYLEVHVAFPISADKNKHFVSVVDNSHCLYWHDS